MLNAGLLVSKRAREIVGDEVLKTVFEEAKLSYVAEIGDFIFEDLKQNDVKSLLVINDGGRETWMEDIDQRLGISPLAVITIPYTWFEGKSQDFTLALLTGYSLRAELMDLVYRVQPTRSSPISRRSLIKLKVYEYKPYPVLYDEVHAEREINRAVEACPLNLVVKTPEGPSVGSPEKCTACGYCSASSFLGYFEVPTATTDQVVAFINAVVKYYSKPASLLFTDGMPSKIVEGVFPFVMPCVASVHDSFVLASYASGLTPIVHVSSTCGTRDMALKRLEEIPSHFPGTDLKVRKAKDDEELRKVLEAPPLDLGRSEIPLDVPLHRSRRRSLLIWSIEEMPRKASMNQDDVVPGVYNVVVDPNKCVLCGVCVRACQMLVPDLKGNDALELTYNIPYCIGSERCVKNCPENAVSVTGFAKISDLKKKLMNKTNVAKCRICGKPIGSEKVKVRVDSMLISQGFQGTAQYTDVCNECKQKELTKIWLERLLSGKR
ncbi:4Fe-4S ferredoxin, iron-sulfur binding domain protein [Metallosphaera sedula]|uniref:4Fe-4S ferredoxin, iron-sulfur binding domain protein n=3 Tax=Metallosphaera TaxID=41980 RepID=A4YEZ0_METS5|nr:MULTISPECIES: 4Fe-4S binding protein [Metallosphaera]ABP94992.1 4Fe-4S ferredoxin, iron-sulfur binding domain protein [Metallosphaera sedula DSM 5348]AIM26978.1 4Fe-4S ferredoxin, iron-sulfur binding domain protein [Metallosphaera sedula]AKV73901.1 4Fe-4S ferredoxin [Metallosphaera sedula]AKV76143.1 4Fe-4S ferredoxin [Metallosphaera sedula]AKV78394.1 4Fe-4S ferredoxin [Metallosphaera sedula]